MASWIYRAVRLSDNEIITHDLYMPTDDDEIIIFNKVQTLRAELASRGYRFLDARPMSAIETRIHSVAKWRAKASYARKPKSGSQKLFLRSLLLLLLLVALVVLWHLYA